MADSQIDFNARANLRKVAFNKNERVPDVGGPILFSKGTLAIREFMSRTAQDLYVP